MTRKRIAAAAVVALLSLAACSSGSQVGASSQTPVPSPSATGTSTPTPTSTPTESSPQPTPTVTEEKTVYVTPTPSPSETTQAPPDGDTVLIGEVVYVKWVEINSTHCNRGYATDVVLKVEDNDLGIKGVQYHDSRGEIGQGASFGETVKITVTPDDYHLITLEQGDEPFPVSGHCVKWAIPNELYGELFLQRVPYKFTTWLTLES